MASDRLQRRPLILQTPQVAEVAAVRGHDLSPLNVMLAQASIHASSRERDARGGRVDREVLL